MKPQLHAAMTVFNHAVIPGRKWVWARRLTQAIGLFALFVGPLLAGWRRLGQSELAAWRDSGSTLPRVAIDALPGAEVGELVGRLNPFLGGGIAAEHVSIPLMDPVAGTLALMHAHVSWRSLVALALPVLVALIAGRIFCGWFCPFGVLVRFIDRQLDLLPWRPRLQIPSHRPLRWFVLGGSIIASLMGVHWLLYISLPYLLLQQTSYAIWLLGGGAAVLAVLLGLLAAGFIWGPTNYCATLCPTGAALSLLGRARPFRLAIAAPSACGNRCNLCNEVCWLHLDPASGHAGPDCDLCMRCVPICPRSNLRLTASKTVGVAKLFLLIAMCGVVSLIAPSTAAGAPMRKPRLLMEREHVQGGVTLAISVVDFSGVSLDADAPEKLQGAEVSLFIARGEPGSADGKAELTRREVYAGALTLQLRRRGENESETLTFAAPTSPISTVERTIYRRRLERSIRQGDELILEPIPGWLAQPVTWVTPPRGASGSRWMQLQFFGAAVLIFMGLISLAFVFSGASETRLLPARKV